ncbi:hypothetical protein AB8Q38_03305 [Klebsiella quasipneumoniae]|uniref:hypothetical protein n=1 Tax=Klebsiella quasipneumoniae TaxID=1463165 RepID=UPI00294776A3|nr:hypothetical protein [Raoultella ornithinolytica]HED4186969.1 hypothetical protein [Raoultella ornithinolytica]
MPNTPDDNNFDIAGFLLAGNIMIKLVEKGVIDMRDAKDIIERTRAAYEHKDLYKDERFANDADTFIDSLFNKLWASRPDAAGKK